MKQSTLASGMADVPGPKNVPADIYVKSFDMNLCRAMGTMKPEVRRVDKCRDNAQQNSGIIEGRRFSQIFAPTQGGGELVRRLSSKVDVRVRPGILNVCPLREQRAQGQT